MTAFSNTLEETTTVACWNLGRDLTPSTADQDFPATDTMLNDCLLEASEQGLTLLQHNVDLVSEVVVLDACFRMSIDLEVAMTDSHPCSSILNDASSTYDVNLTKLLLLYDQPYFDLAKYLHS